MTVNEKGLEAAQVAAREGCGLFIESQHVFCDDPVVGEAADGYGKPLRQPYCSCKGDAERIIKAYLRAASKDAEPMAWIAEAGENKQPCLCWTEAVALSEADGDRSRITPLFTHPSTGVEGVNAVADAWTAITTERNRQISDEGWTAEHDDEHRGGEMLSAAVAYTWHGTRMGTPDGSMPGNWPWGSEWWKPMDRERNLVRAGALCLAERERRLRAHLHPGPADHKLGIVLRELVALTAIEPVAASPGVGEPKLTAYETQVLIGTSISGCNMSPDRVFDLKAAWARLYDLGLIDRTDGLAIVTPTGEARIKALLAAAPTSPAPSPAGRDVRDAAFEEEWEQAEGACGRIEMVANHMRNGDAARGVLLEAVQTIRALSSKQRSGE